MDKRSIIAIGLCVLFYLGYNHYLSVKYPNQGRRSTAPTASDTPQGAPGNGTGNAPGTLAGTASAPNSTGPASASAGGATAAAAPQVRLTAEELRLSSDLAVYQFSQDNGGLQSVTLNKYTDQAGPGASPIDLLDAPMAVQGMVLSSAGGATGAGSFNAERQGRSVKFWRDLGDFRLTQEWRIPEHGYSGSLKVSLVNISGKPVDLTAGVTFNGQFTPEAEKKLLGFLPGQQRVWDELIYKADTSTEWLDMGKFCKGDKEAPSLQQVPVKYFGFDHHYFLTAFLPKGKTSSLRLEHGKEVNRGCGISMLSFDRFGMVAPGDAVTMEFDTYFGPKDLAILQSEGSELDSSIRLGAFGFIGKPLLAAIQGFQRVTHNYGLAIILLTFCLKVLFYPLVRASSMSMHRMKKLNPQMQAIRDKWKDDRQRQQLELMQFMQKNKINPAKGCLPILPQIPVFFAFYQVLQTSIQLRHAPFYGWIHDLAAMDPYLVTPLLMGVAMFVQQKLTPTTGMDKTQEKILMFMPIMFTVMMLTLPAGLTLYMLTNTITGILQQKWLYRKLDRTEPSMVLNAG